METDARNFSQLVLSTFLQDNYLVNNDLPLFRIQTVNVAGTPQDFDEIVSHSRKDVVNAEALSLEEWEKHVDGIKNLCVLANQASEFEIKKNLTEGKTGIVQPDLISSKNIEESLMKGVTSPDTPKKKLLVLEKTDEKISSLKVEYKRQELLKSPLNPTVAFPGVQDEKVVTPESPKFPTASPAKSPTPSVKSKVSVEPQSPKFPTGSPAKKLDLSNDKPNIVKMEPKIVKPVNDVVLMQPVQNEASKAPVTTKQLTPTVKEATKTFIEAEKEAPNPVAATKAAISPNKPKPLNLPPLPIPEPQPVPQETAKIQPSNLSQSMKHKKHKLILAKPPNILVYSDSITTRDNVIKTLGSILQRNTYTIYPLSVQQASSRVWLDNTSLLVVCGSVNGSEVGQIFLDFFFKGGKVLCLCSDLLRHVLPTYHTAEVSERIRNLGWFFDIYNFRSVSTNWFNLLTESGRTSK